jgi:ornithine cyclodeaminase
MKSASTSDIAGLKVGSFWPGNPSLGFPRHQSTIFLFDQKVGRIAAAIEASKANGFRTAAADAVAASVLAREDAKTIAIFGTGQQAEHECLAVSHVRKIKTVLVVSRLESNAAAFAGRLTQLGLSAIPAGAEVACRAADIIITATPSRQPLFDADWVSPGAYVASMGSDRKGKQELPPRLFERSSLFCDLPSQSIDIGEYQHIAEGIRSGAQSLCALGDILTGKHPGRRDPDEITVFDSSGLALQDLFLAQAILARAAA